MDRTFTSRSFMLLAAMLVVALPLRGCGATSAGPGEEQERSYTVRAWTFQHLSRVQEKVQEGQLQEAREELLEMTERRGLNDHEQALIWQALAHVQVSLGDNAGALVSLEKALGFDALPPETTATEQYNLAQLYVANERYAEGAERLRQWLDQADNPAPETYFLLATALVQDEQYDAALEATLRAIEESASPPEPWLKLAVSLCITTERYDEAESWLKRLIEQHPSQEYWRKLADVYVAQGNHSRALAAMEVLHHQGALEDPADILGLARQYLSADLPLRAVALLREEMAAGRVPETAESLSLLGESLHLAHLDEEAEKVLARAGELAETGEPFVRIAQRHFAVHEWKQVRRALERAFAKGGLRDPARAHLMLGIALVQLGDGAEARAHLEQAAESPELEPDARTWMKHLSAPQK